jgi:LL-diaminopimelate aminotransferase
VIQSKNLSAIPEYIHSRLTKEAKKVEKTSNRKVLNLGQGTPDVRPSEIYLSKLHEFIDYPNSHLYPGYNAIPELSDALISWYKKRFGVEISKDEVLPLLGEKDGIAHFPFSYLNPGDELLVPDPGYPPFYEPALLAGVKTIPYDLTEKNEFKLDISEIEKKLTKKSKAVWVNFPSNPTGQTATLKELKELVYFAKSNNILILYDNAYSEITFEGFRTPSIFEAEGAKDVAIEFCSFSKTYSFAGFRMGWVAGSKENIAPLSKMKTQMDSGMMLPLQHLGAYVLTNQDLKWHEMMLESYRNRRDIIAKYLPKLGLRFSMPKSALYFWARIPESEKNSEDFCMKNLYEKQILMTPGSAFGNNGERYVRISYCVNIEGIEKYF